MKLIATDGNITLKVLRDADAMNPREEMDGWLGKMVCSHNRYNLGDEEAQNTESYSNWKEWLKGEVGSSGDLIALPLFLYDHSGITISTAEFSCPWDSGQVGWIYAHKQKFLDETGYTDKALFGTDPNAPLEAGDYVTIEGVDKPYFGKVQSIDGGNVTIDWTYLYVKEKHSDPSLRGIYPIEKVKLVTEYAKTMLKNEVKVYDQYLTGDVWGYVLEKSVKICAGKCEGECKGCGEEIVELEESVLDSCWGFYGSDPLTNGMVGHIESKYHYLLDLLK